jgi:hypothetical protein
MAMRSAIPPGQAPGPAAGKMPAATRSLAPRWTGEKILQIHPYFFPLEYACTGEGTNAFAYETG